MASAKICDRCKKVEKGSAVAGWSELNLALDRDGQMYHRNERTETIMDLCTDCTRAAFAFLKEPVSLT